MHQNIFLSRHGITPRNKWKLDLKTKKEDRPISELDTEGKEQAKILGLYLKSKNLSNIMFITSKLSRAIDTTKIVADSIGIELDEDNYLEDENLRERTYFEGALYHNIKLSQSFIKWFKEIVTEEEFNYGIELSNLDLDDKKNKDTYFEFVDSMVDKYEEIKRLSFNEIGIKRRESVIKLAKLFPNKNIILVLHGTINYVLVRILGVDKNLAKQTRKDHCGLWKLEREGDELKVVGDYLSNPEMKSLLNR